MPSFHLFFLICNHFGISKWVVKFKGWKHDKINAKKIFLKFFYFCFSWLYFEVIVNFLHFLCSFILFAIYIFKIYFLVFNTFTSFSLALIYFLFLKNQIFFNKKSAKLSNWICKKYAEFMVFFPHTKSILVWHMHISLTNSKFKILTSIF